ncbi:peptidoglycan bridge formation protein FemAB [Streptomyces noursei ZPM]|uniref:Peptidoglycan bridge formation protein FemAB n=1 Tax=Streptomyces noursei TaxID=1971 RepID=A0A401QRM4_STRNR|nr:peptidoglycan bridge formation glycyltransferase FemA/FemB family protein [Streptomyces noursei]AKA01168.1 peptidoglycan bridge formation protein FemAB [Streptomyces noursei ZPM]AKA08245.1 peptidoglycan bridge formation protein FemAB [Streptomyces noursei ZPM]EOT02555.1 peptidoglycan bridge formation protein FemAB [Streptomyces noursei CCRC 11814]EXU92372.1 peptidoglycan bridge formation protein FemAB [Streptomyces noursei PD-1]GCB88069.1 peptidoglycan bridge formation protein FemAB [Strept
MSYRLKAISREEHLDFIRSLVSVSHMQIPSWGDVKPDWRAESLGWFDDSGRLVGAGLVLMRPLPKVKRYLAYLPEGPTIDWSAPDVERWLEPMLAYLKERGAFSVKMGPPVVARRWSAEAVKVAIADPRAQRLRDVEATEHEPRAFDIADRLRRMGWQQTEPGREDSFSAGQPRYVFQVSLAGRSLDEVWSGLNQQWRRNVKKAQKAGVKVLQGDYEELPAFYSLYVETAERDRFSPRPLDYFQRMWKVLRAEDPNRMRLYLAHHEGDVLAAATMLTVGGHVWYSYGASTSRKREVQPNNAIQWRMMSDAHELEADIYDFRGITDALSEDNHLLGLLRFKVGSGGQAVEYLGEWDYPLNKVLHKALDFYISRR